MSIRTDMPRDASSWRQITLVTVVVLLAHAALLGSLPQWGAKETPLPLEQRFVTRTIVVAPPAPPAPPAPAAAAPVNPPAKKAPEHRAAPPRRAATPHPAPRKEEAPPPPAPVMATPDTAAEQARSELAPPEDTSAAGEPAPVNDTGVTGGTGAAEGPGSDGDAAAIAAGLPRAGQSLQVHSSVRLNFELLGQRGVQPWKGVFGELVWLQDGSEYNAQLSLKMLFKTIRNQTSMGRIDASGVAPNRFSETRRSELASHFVREEGKVVFSNNAPDVPLLPGAQDRLSVVMQLGALLSGDPARYPEGSRISIQTVGTREAGVWTFVVEGTERISVPSGEYEVRRLSRTPRNEHDYKLELWLAPALGWLPARMRQTQLDGDVIDLQLREVSAP